MDGGQRSVPVKRDLRLEVKMFLLKPYSERLPNETLSRKITHLSIIPLFHYSNLTLGGSVWAV